MALFTPQEFSLREFAFRLPLLLLTIASIPSWTEASSNDSHKAVLQRQELSNALGRCFKLIFNATVPTDGGLYCEPVWDKVTCWPNYVKAGVNATQFCPDYIQGFNHLEKAVRSCTEDGTWGKNPNDKSNTSWTDFRRCLKKPISPVPAIIEENMPIVIQISTIGYSISLATLIVATAIMVLFRKLHCQRNTIHMNLFISFMFRAVISLLRDMLLVKHLALPSDIKYSMDGTIIFIQEGTHWECKLLNTLWQYSLNANYMWIFVEGLYLHTLIFFAVFSQSKKFFKLYILIGWVLPLIFIITWVLVRIFKNNTLCWNTHDKGYYWILNAPIVSSISVNFFFFLNIIRVLFTKIRDCNTRDPRRYRKLAKSTLVLIPLFGVYYTIFIVLDNYKEPKIAVAHMYIEITLNSFQGTVVALLFCFLNGEVRAEIMKKWHRHWLRRQSVVSGRSSRALSTASYYIGRDRHSLSLAIPLCDVSCREDRGVSPPQSPVNNNNGRVFHEVSSMPKLSFNSSSSTMNPLPRVSSASKVTFNCVDNIISQNQDSLLCPPEGSSDKTYSEDVCNGSLEASKVDETKSLLSAPSRMNYKDSENTSMSKPHFKSLNLKCNTRTLNYNGATGDDMLNLPHRHTVNSLSPLSDTGEDSAETISMVN